MGQILYAGAIHRTEQAKIDASRITQASGNEKRAAVSELGRFSQSLGNQRIMDAAGKDVNAMGENIARNLDEAATGLFGSRVAAAEQLGSNMAAASAAGVGGSSIDMLNETLGLSQAMLEERGQRSINSDLRGASNARGDVLTNAVASLGNDVIAADMDFTKYVDHKKPSSFSRLSTLATAAAAAFVGGPQAGQAVLSLADSSAAASNGDYAGASKSLMAGISGGIKGVETYRTGAETSGDFGGAWGNQFFRRSSRSSPTYQPVNNVSKALNAGAGANIKLY